MQYCLIPSFLLASWVLTFGPARHRVIGNGNYSWTMEFHRSFYWTRAFDIMKRLEKPTYTSPHKVTFCPLDRVYPEIGKVSGLYHIPV